MNKRDVLLARECLRRAWLDKKRGHLKPEVGEAELARMEVGQQLGMLARGLYPGGAVGWDSGAEVMYEASFEVGGFVTRVDILRKVGSGYWICEVKSSGKVKEDHLIDVAFQWGVLEMFGLDVVGASVVHVNTGSVVGETIDVQSFFVETEVTKDVRGIVNMIREEGEIVQEVFGHADTPQRIWEKCCLGCDFWEYCWPDRVEGSVLELPRVRAEQIADWEDEGVVMIKDIPAREGEKLKGGQELVWLAETGKELLDTEGLKADLSGLEYPLGFLDFEAAGSAVPMFAGLRPYEVVPFQYSLHVVDEPRGELRHLEYLAPAEGDPRGGFAEGLARDVAGVKTLVYYSNYEVTTVRRMVSDGYVGLRDVLVGLQKGVDLLAVVKKRIYLKAFRGSYSIKTVLPALVPGLNYDGMAVGDGEAAVLAYLKLRSGELGDEEAGTLRQALIDYCRQDTLAMVEIYRWMCGQAGLF